jgi:apolipoprotein D and lipocalin family protein
MRTVLSALILVTVMVVATGCASVDEPLRTVPHVDLPRYMGDWYVIGEIPYFAEKDCIDSIESYALRPDGDIDNWFTCRKKTFDAPMKRKVTTVAKVKDKTTNAEWRVILDCRPGPGLPVGRRGTSLAQLRLDHGPEEDAG